MKLIRRTAFLLVLVVGAAAGWPANAAEYTIKGGTGVALSSGGFIMSGARGPACNAALVQHPGQGVDSYLLDVSSFAGRRINLNWRADQDLGGLDVAFYKNTCDVTIINGQAPHAQNPGTWSLLVPGDAKWILVAPSYAFNVTFSINPA